jgi:hypothetical protein
MKQKSGWKRITLLRKTSFKKRLKILAGYNRQTGSDSLTRMARHSPAIDGGRQIERRIFLKRSSESCRDSKGYRDVLV